MVPNAFLGVIFHWLGGLASASNFIPFRGIRRWSWEIYWIVQGVAAWLVAPALAAVLLVPRLSDILHHAPRASVGFAIFWGAMWGIGGLTFGLAIRYLGIGLGYAIALGLCTAFGTLMPPLFHGQLGAILHERSGRVILAGVVLCLIAVAVNGAAGYSKEKQTTAEEKAEAGEHDYSMRKGLAVAVFAGLLSACFAYGLDAGKPIAHLARQTLLAQGRPELWKNLPVLVVVLWGGFATNLIWSTVMMVRNRSAAQFAGTPGFNPLRAGHATGNSIEEDPRELQTRLKSDVLLKNYVFAGAAGLLWYLQFFFYSMGETKMGKYDFSSWTLHMASIIIFATLWGVALHEWRGSGRRTRWLVSAGLFLLVLSTVVVGYGNYLKSS